MIGVLAGLLGPLMGKVIDVVGGKLGVDLSSEELKKTKMELELELTKILAEQEKAIQEANIKQIEVNIAEAKSSSIFVAGWRPFIGWMCGSALAYHYILQPLLVFALTSAGQEVELPAFDMQSLLTVLMGMLGLGAMRTYEKTKGVVRGSNPSTRKGRLVHDEEAGGLVWREY